MEVEKPFEPRHEGRGNRCLVRDARFDLIGREQDLPAAADLSQMTPSRMSAKSFSRTVSQRRYHQTNRDRERDKLAIGLKREALSRTCRRPQRTRALLDPRDARSNQGAPGTARRDSQWLLPLALLRRGMTVGARCPEASCNHRSMKSRVIDCSSYLNFESSGRCIREGDERAHPRLALPYSNNQKVHIYTRSCY